ncbi:GNAT superfamily N-acetyltransferase [Catenulispora sp. GAS73]|uniref:GNAT family N-acetyltransferase n=1 Tax=Catenulispora sp. GAS73 TaxID=3156269 RepID=UPI003518DE02
MPSRTGDEKGHGVDTFRQAGVEDAEAVARLHADSWRRHYRGAYADAYLDGDILSDRVRVWSSRLAAPTGTVTVLAEDDAGPAGFMHLAVDDDSRWGSLVDNLHVRLDRQRAGVGTALLRRAVTAVVELAQTRAMYLWVQEQNQNAQRFYAAMGGTCVEKSPIESPGGVPGRLVGAPLKLRIAWPDVADSGF